MGQTDDPPRDEPEGGEGAPDGEISKEEFIRRGPEEDPSFGASAGPGAPETLEPTQGRPGGPGGAGMERPQPAKPSEGD